MLLNFKKINMRQLRVTARRLHDVNLDISEHDIFMELLEGRCAYLADIGQLFNPPVNRR